MMQADAGDLYYRQKFSLMWAYCQKKIYKMALYFLITSLHSRVSNALNPVTSLCFIAYIR